MKSKKYEFLPHIADVKFKAYGKTLEEAFENAAYALTDVMISHEKVKGNKEKTILVESENIEALLYDFLEQFLILLDSEGFLLNKFDKLKIKELKKDKNGNRYSLSADVSGDDELKKYKIDTHIKAVTYEQMEIKTEKKGAVVQVILDI